MSFTFSPLSPLPSKYALVEGGEDLKIGFFCEISRNLEITHTPKSPGDFEVSEIFLIFILRGANFSMRAGELKTERFLKEFGVTLLKGRTDRGSGFPDVLFSAFIYPAVVNAAHTHINSEQPQLCVS